MTYSHPGELLVAIRGRIPAARLQLRDLYTDILRSALRRMGMSAGDAGDGEDAILRWLTMFLATRDPAVFQRLPSDGELAWREFRSYVVWVVFRWLLWPISAESPIQHCGPAASGGFRSNMYWVLDVHGPPAMSGYPNPHSFELAIYQRPKHVASGDLVQAVPTAGEFWLLVADGSGHGCLVNLIMRGVSFLFREAVLEEPVEPAGVLQRLQDKLEPHVPDGFFIEAALVRIDHSGTMVLAAAGGVVIVHRDSGGSEIRFDTLSGCLLGNIGYPEVSFEQSCWKLHQGKEMLLSTDGLFDQSTSSGSLREALPGLLAGRCDRQGLFEAVVQEATDALSRSGQNDDISLACLKVH